MSDQENFPAVLTIAGSDSGGGAGIQADLRTFNIFKVYGCSAITAVTSQNPSVVRRVDILTPEAVRCQIETVLDAIPVRFAKTGMLATGEIIECVADMAVQQKISLVVDPVMVSTSGTQLLEKTAISAMQEKLFPQAQWLTPNIPEAELICRRQLKTFEDLADTAVTIYEKYKCNVILKGGHFADTETAADIVCYQGQLWTLSSPHLAGIGNSTHGTGCTLSAALAANLALGKSWELSVMEAKAFIFGSLAENIRLNSGLFQMYPPRRSYFEKISLKKYR